MAEIQVRPVGPSDLPRLMGLDHSLSTERVWQLELRRDPRGAEIAATFREARLPRPVSLPYPKDPFALADDWTRKAMMMTAVSGGDVAGYIAIEVLRGTAAWITDLVVAPRWRRQGVASTLLASAHEWGTGRGLRRLFLEMQSKNHPAIQLAQKHGYDFCGYNDRYYSTHDIALFFSRAL